ncbi:hypothetical protein [Aurantimonas phage AmM-1]|uniref:hypothetical protein n=1 Tax=Aurantimonas phage AmM-1 TaxID=1503929 RepID=UPI000540C6CF|nr:hypothetical protein ACQ23_gp20 [Aurantimonas phage AmM-1]BAP94477.1 hypothetical protein [Aurantimonas phage AmM-1]
MPDHCTLWPDRLGGIDWSACCKAHDGAYDLGGDAAARLAADLDLASCVAAVAGWPMATLMFFGVAIFGWLFWRRR